MRKLLPYLLDGKEARGEDYVAAIDCVAAASTDDPAWICVTVPSVATLVISTGLGGLCVEDQRSDGSSWTKHKLTKAQAKDMVAVLLTGGTDWRVETGWKLTELAPKDAGKRMLWIVLSGVALGGVAWSLIRHWTQ